jgi:zinc transport system substrate-binding protein
MKKVLISLLAISMLAGCSAANETSSSDEALKVAATIFPIADIASSIGGDKVQVEAILPAGSSPHTFNASPSDIRKISGSDVVFSVGHDLDGWITEMIENSDAEVEVKTVDAGIELMEFEGHHDHDDHEHEEEHHDDDHEHDEEHEGHEEDDHDEHEGHDHEGVDPHYWLSASNGSVIAENIANVFIELDPSNEGYYMSNLEAFQNEMVTLNTQIKETIASGVEKPEMIVFHDSWAYFASAYGLEVIATFEPSPGKEPTPKYLEELYESAEAHGLSAVFSEPQLSSDALDPFVEDLGLSIYVLDPLGGLDETGSYMELLLSNAQTIAEAI